MPRAKRSRKTRPGSARCSRRWARVIVGQRHLLDRLLIALLTNGHVLLEGVPGLAKTLALKTLASCIALHFKRLQFTPDMLPADIVGTMIYNPQDGAFRTKHGPIFSNLILADEINRAPAKVQSALLEAMQERQVTIGDETYPLPNPFLGAGHAESLGTGGNLSAAGGANRSVHDEGASSTIRTAPKSAPFWTPWRRPKPMLVARPVVSAAQIVDARHVVNTLYVDEQDPRLHRRPGARDAPAHRGVLESERLHPKRRLAARDHRLDAWPRAPWRS